ncbi:hypothetical protein HMPREF0433_00575 [Gemella sanguinis M325]|jgi:putative uncharacterized protein gbs1976|uniref:DUF1310 domain-containing protein n=1 Tax=Gemella sanguinis TaxID=84135 RepID=A0ABX6FHB0_9BACL|nr:hypothetical protein [Gemella sanguinis]EGF88559.1 hypothetical protein HMPREF0433_00575 [Gemella sanguinis M325]QGS07410.1 hypothetical protein FOC50_03480 [Gemella sanguinis]
MRDMLSVILRLILGIIVFFVIIIVFAFNYETGEDKREIRQDQDRMVQYVLEKTELKNNEEIKRIKVIEFKKNFSTGTWKCEIEINGKYNIMLKEDELGGEIRTSLYNADEICINKEKVNKINNVEREYL